MGSGTTTLAERLALLETLFEHAPVGVAFLDREGRYVRANDILAELHQTSPANLVGQRVAEQAPALWEKIRGFYERALAGERVINVDVSGVIAQHPDRHWLVSYFPVWIDGAIVGVGVFVNDITERRQAEQALRHRNDLYAMLARTNQAAAQCQTREGLFRELCSIAVEIGKFRFAWVGVPRDGQVELVASAGDDGGYMQQLVVSLDEADPRAHGPTGRCVRLGESVVVNDFHRSPLTMPWHAEAARVGFRASAAFPLREQGHVVAALTLYADEVDFFTPDLHATLCELMPSAEFALDRFVHEERRSHDEAELRLRDRAMSAVTQGIVIVDATAEDRPIIYASPSFLRLTGYEAHEVLGRNCRLLQGKDTSVEAVEELRRAIAEERATDVELLNYRKDGTAFWNAVAISPVFDPAGKVSHFVGVQTDLTARRELELQLRQSQKMDAIGSLAAGVAHDFNNLLSVILSYSALVAGELGDKPALRDDLQQITRAGQRAAELTRQLLAFSRSQMLTPRVLDLGEVLGAMDKMLRRLLGAHIQLSVVVAQPLGRVLADPGQIEQIVMNLAVNAHDAMPHGGTLTIEAADLVLDEASAAKHHDVPPGPYVMLTVTDSGVGMDATTRERVFEPFFTTKERGRGTGLGLSTVFGIVKQSHGHIWVESELHRGTSMKILLPRTERSSAPSVPVPSSSTLRGDETVLLVEDEEQARVLCREVLRRSGYRVLEAQNGGEALLVCEQHPGRIDLLLTDVVMPRMGGQQMAERLRPLRPEMKQLFMSGYGPVAELRAAAPDAAFLVKPLTPESLLRKVREVLDRAPGDTEERSS